VVLRHASPLTVVGGCTTMTDALLMVLVVGVLLLALGVDLAAVIGWLRRWKS